MLPIPTYWLTSGLKMGNQNSVKKHIEHAEKSGVCQLSGLQIEDVSFKIVIVNLAHVEVKSLFFLGLPVIT